MPDLVLTYRGRIYPWHCDHLGHMNVMWYVGKFDDGLTGKRMRAEDIGMASCWPAISSPFVPGQEVREKVLLFAHEMVHEETQEVAARTLLTAVFLDTKTRKARSLPADVREQVANTFPRRGPRSRLARSPQLTVVADFEVSV